MRRALLAAALVCVGVLALASPASAYTPPETDPRIVITTSQGTILVALAPENAPKHVAEFLAALTSHDFDGAAVARVAPTYYVQLVGKLGTAQLAGLPVERVKVGNLHGAMSIYDNGQAGQVPTLMFVLVTSPQLDPDYTSIGFVEAGMSLLTKIAEIPTTGDHQPTQAVTITGIHFATPQERAELRQAEQTPKPDAGTALLAAVFILAFAAFVAAGISAFRDRLSKHWIKSLWLMVALLCFFAVWVGIGASTHGSGLVGVVLFGGAIAMFRLMGRFERPAQILQVQPVAESAPHPDGEPHGTDNGIDHTERNVAVVVGQGDEPTGHLGRARR
ncbi:MAG: peptidyl-prolyl cis-trans isomerase [Ilumatobacteraceae bacterium]